LDKKNHIVICPYFVKADNPYFVTPCKETQRWHASFILFTILIVICHEINNFNFAVDGITISTKREIDNTYLDSNEEDIKKHFAKPK
jgi:hypothetical protein